MAIGKRAAGFHKLSMSLNVLLIVVKRRDMNGEAIHKHDILLFSGHGLHELRRFKYLPRKTRAKGRLYELSNSRLKAKGISRIELGGNATKDIHSGNLLLHLLSITRRLNT